MLHSGYEASAVDYTFSFRGVFATVRAMLFSQYRDADALEQIEVEKPQAPLVQIEAIAPRPTLKGTDIAGPDQLADGIEQAFDYRGDVTVTLNSGESPGRLYLRSRMAATAAASTMRIVTGRPEGHRQLLRRRARLLHRPRYGGRTQLGSLGPEVRRAQSRRREEHRTRARSDRLARVPRSHIHACLTVLRANGEPRPHFRAHAHQFACDRVNGAPHSTRLREHNGHRLPEAIPCDVRI